MRSKLPGNYDELPSGLQRIDRRLWLKPMYEGFGKEITDKAELQETWLKLITNPAYHPIHGLPGLLGDLQFHLGADPEKIVCEQRGDKPDFDVYFQRGEGLFKLNFSLCPIGVGLEEYTERAMKELMDDMYLGIVDDNEPDWVVYDPKTGLSIATKIDVEAADNSIAAKEVQKISYVALDDLGNVSDSRVYMKINNSAETNEREKSILEGIVANEELQNLGVSAPEVCENMDAYLFTKDVPYTTVEDYLENGKATPIEKDMLIKRIAKATEIIEKDIIPAPTEEEVQKAMEMPAGLGKKHKEIVEYLNDKGMFDRSLSDSRFTNWLYDAENDTLYKIDENAPGAGSKYSCIGRFADFKAAIPEDERDKIIESMLEEGHTMKDAFLSIYAYLVNSALKMKSRYEISGDTKHYDGMISRLDRAAGYLNRIDDEQLKIEFEEALIFESALIGVPRT